MAPADRHRISNRRGGRPVSGVHPRALDALEFGSQGRGVLVVSAGRFGLREERTGAFGLPLREQLARRRKHLLGASLSLGKGRARPIDVGAGTRVGSVQKKDPRPHMNGVFVLTGKVPIEPFDEQRLSAAVAVGDLGSRRGLEALRFRHR